MQEKFSRLEKQGHPLNTSSGNVSNMSHGIIGKKASSGIRRLMFHNKCGLKSHMDSVRGLHFISSINALASASEDMTIKLWDVNKFSSMKEVDGVINFEPYLALRGHTDPILSLSGRSNSSND
jgi:WD40 repeat protein